MQQEQREIKNKSLFLVYLYSIVTFGIYYLVWAVKSKRDMNAIGANIPTSWMLIVPIVNIYWQYKYFAGYSATFKNGKGTALYFILHAFTGGLFTPFLVQSELNKLEPSKNTSHAELTKVAA
jgi:hypothetical protein